ncbi:MAG: YbjQ family protein [Lentisphaeria bacterium]|nr:YbjQ family protein [Lentisphaeria bacterium]
MNSFELFLIFGFPFLTLVAGFIVNRVISNLHLKKLNARESRLKHIMVSQQRHTPSNLLIESGMIVTSEVVLSVGYFRSWIAGWIQLVGGNISGYEDVMQRARREAIVRVMEQAHQANAPFVWNLRIEAVDLYLKKGGRCLAVIVTGTAMKGQLH